MYYHDAETFLQLIFEALFAPYGTGYVFQGVDWGLQYTFAKGSKFIALLYPTIERLSKEYPIPEELLAKWKQEADVQISKNKVTQNAFSSFLEKAKKENIPFALFKGATLANLYPNPLLRNSKDTDLYVNWEDGPEFLRFLERIGYQKDLHDSKDQVPVYIKEEPFHRIEVHFSLWEDYKGPKIQTLDTYSITDEATFISISTSLGELPSLGYEEHLLYQLFHLIKHVIVEGIGFQGITDICLYINKYGSLINYDKLWKKLEELGYAHFCEILFQCSIKYLHMEPSIMEKRVIPNAEERGLLLLEFVRAIMIRLNPTYFSLFCQLTQPYVDGMDLYADPETYLQEHENDYAPIRERIDEKISTLHQFGLTSKETKLSKGRPFTPVVIETDLTAGKKGAKYFYQAYGLTIASEIEMHELFPADTEKYKKEDADIYVHFSEQPNTLDNPFLQRIEQNRIWFQTHNCKFLCQNGNEVIVEKKDESYSDNEIKAYIISHGLVFNLYMRNIITLHSATVGTDSGAITLLGDCGAGKSTYSTLLRKEGYKLIADDVSAITLENGVPMVQLAVPQQKYTVDTALKEGYQLEDLECIDQKRKKYRVILPDDAMCKGPTPLKGVFELVPDWDNNRLKFEKLEGMNALRILTMYMFCQYMFNNTGGLSVEAFQTALAIAKDVPIYRIYRPTDWDARQEILDFILSVQP